MVDVVRSAAWLAGTMAGHSVRIAASGSRAAVSAAQQLIETADRGVEAAWDVARDADLGDRAGDVAATATAELADAGPSRSHRSVWRSGGRAHIEIRGRAGRAGRDIAAGISSALRGVRGVRWVQVSAVTRQVLVAFDEDKVSLDTVLGLIQSVERDHGADHDEFGWSQPEVPGDPEAENAALAALAWSVAGTGLAAAGRIARLPGLPAAIRVPAVLAQHHPRIRSAFEERLGPRPFSLAMALFNAATYATTVDPYPLAVESAQRALAFVEARSRRLAWERRSGELFGSVAVADAERTARPVPLPPGPVEKVSDRASIGGLAGAAGLLAATREPGRAADLLLATAPKAARMGREAFASALAHELNRNDILTLNGSALRRLDRVSAVVIDSAVLVAGDQTDPLADAMVGAAKDCAEQVLLTDEPAAADLLPLADEVVPGGDGLAERIRALQREGHVVLAVSAADAAALAAADVGIGLARDKRVCWTADLLGGPGLEDPWRLLKAVQAARGASDRAAKLAIGGASLGALMLAAERTVRFGLTPGNSAAALSVLASAESARSTGRLPRPRPVPRERWHEMTAEDVLRRLSPDNGPARGGQSDGRPQDQDPSSRPQGALAMFGRAIIDELRDPLTPVLGLGAAASAILGSGVDAALVGGVVTGNALIGAAQKVSAERALDSLLLSEQLPARRVTADGSTDSVAASDLVPGDVVELHPSDVVPADVRLLESDGMEADQATITGESLPVPKDPEPTPGAELADRSCMLYEGTTVLTGEGRAVVVAVGQATEAGRATAAAGGGGRAVGVQARLAELTRISVPATGIAGAAVAGISLLRRVPFTESLAAGVSVAVAAVPEGLPLVATVSQFAAARRLSRLGVLVRSPRTLEALGRVDTFCFDKTGTLTEGRLAVTRVAGPGEDGADLPSHDPAARAILRAACRASPEDGKPLSHATDRAIVEAARDWLGSDEEWSLIREQPFESNRGYSAAVGQAARDKQLLVKGAPEVVLERCATAGDGQRLSGEHRDAVARRVRELAEDGLRVIAVAVRHFDEDEASAADGVDDLDALADGLDLLGFVGIADRPRPEATETIELLASAGVRVTMITGDHPVTASAVARQIGIPGSDTVLTGMDIEALSDRALTERASRAAVFARVSPEQKVRVVRALQRAGRVVAMTGDGVNDAAAIRLADVGIGVAAKGSASARTAASLVLTDPDPRRLVDMLAEGRSLWERVRDAVSILVGGNAGEVAFTVAGTAVGGRAPLNTRQLLMVNMFTDMLPALAVALGPLGGGQISEKTVDLSAGPASLSRETLIRSLAVRGAATACGAGAAWFAGRPAGRNRAGTMGLGALVMTQLGQTMLTGWRSPLVVVTCVASAGALVAVVETPGVSQFFGCTPLGPVGWGVVAASSALATVGSAAVPRLLPARED